MVGSSLACAPSTTTPPTRNVAVAALTSGSRVSLIQAWTVSILSAPGGIAQALEKERPPPFLGQVVSIVFFPAWAPNDF